MSRGITNGAKASEGRGRGKQEVGYREWRLSHPSGSLRDRDPVRTAGPPEGRGLSGPLSTPAWKSDVATTRQNLGSVAKHSGSDPASG